MSSWFLDYDAVGRNVKREQQDTPPGRPALRHDQGLAAALSQFLKRCADYGLDNFFQPGIMPAVQTIIARVLVLLQTHPIATYRCYLLDLAHF
jgi:hypothetical protein